jgi:hypothetical protein
MHQTANHNNLFRPDIAPNRAGGLILHQNGQRIVIEDGEVELFVSELQRIRKRQLIDDCRRIAGCAA